MILIDIQKKDDNSYTLEYVDTNISYNTIKKIDIKLGEDIFQQVNFKDFLIETVNEEVTVWDRSTALLLKDIEYASTQKLAIKDNVYIIEDMLIELGVAKAYMDTFNKKIVENFFEEVHMQHGNIQKMIKIYKIEDEQKIQDIYRYYKFSVLRDKFIKNTLYINDGDYLTLYDVVYESNEFSEEVKKMSSTKLFKLFSCNFRLIYSDNEELPF